MAFTLNVVWFTLLCSHCSVRVPAYAKATAWLAVAQCAEAAGSVLVSPFGAPGPPEGGHYVRPISTSYVVSGFSRTGPPKGGYYVRGKPIRT